MFSERLLLLQGEFQHPLSFLPYVGGCPSLLGKVTFLLVGSARNNTDKRWGGGWAHMTESSPSMHRDLGLIPSTSTCVWWCMSVQHSGAGSFTIRSLRSSLAAQCGDCFCSTCISCNVPSLLGELFYELSRKWLVLHLQRAERLRVELLGTS